MNDLALIKTENVKIGDFILTKNYNTIFEIVRSGDVMTSFAPDGGVMRCFYCKNNDWKKNEITIDYFNSEFYGPYDKEAAEKIICIIQKDSEK